MCSTKSARSRASPVAGITGAPGFGATHRSGSTRSTATWTRRTTSPGIVRSATIRRVSEASAAPSSMPVVAVTMP